MALAVATSAASGLGLGLRAGGTAVASCAAALRSGDGVVVEGALETAMAGRGDAEAARARSEDGPAGRWVRATLREAAVAREGRSCDLPRVLVRVGRPESSVAAGARVRAVGEWRRFGSASGGVRTLDAYGAVYGVLAPSPARDAGTRGAPSPLVSLRARASARLERSLPPDVVPAAKALVLAERSELHPRVTRRFADAGLVHLLAISGLHIGILGAGVLWLAGLVAPGAARYPVAAAITAAYVALIGAPPAAVRAALLFGGLALARLRGRPAGTGDLLGLAAAASLVANPLFLVQPGFQLSFAGFAGLLAGDRAAARWLSRRDGSGAGAGGGRSPGDRVGPLRAARGLALRAAAWSGGRGLGGGGAARRPRGLARGLAASTGAFLFTAPIAAAHFGRVAPAAILSNLAGAPLLTLALMGLAAALLLPGALAGPFADGAGAAIRALLRTADFFAGLPLHGEVAPPDPLTWLSGSLLAAGLWSLARGARGVRSARTVGIARRIRRGLLLLGAAGGLWLAAPGLRALGARGATLLCSLDVGQGDAAVLRTRRGHWVVMDAGPGPGFRSGGGGYVPGGGYDAGARVVVPFLRSRGARAVDLFVLSHPHLDHLGGAAGLFRAFPVRRVLEAGVPLGSGAYLAFLGGVEEEGAEWLAARDGTRLRIDEAELLVLAPAADWTRSAVDPNDVSVAIRVRIDGSFVYLNTGDAPMAAEREVLARWPADSLRADLLKIGHHGSRTSTSPEWLAAAEPHLAVISAGASNRYGHPHPSILARLDSVGVPRVWRTDREGTLCVEVRRGGSWRVVGG